MLVLDFKSSLNANETSWVGYRDLPPQSRSLLVCEGILRFGSSDRMQIITDRTGLAHFPLTPFLRRRRTDTLFVDIQSKIEFFFHWCVCLFELFKTATPNAFGVGAALLHLKKEE